MRNTGGLGRVFCCLQLHPGESTPRTVHQRIYARVELLVPLTESPVLCQFRTYAHGTSLESMIVPRRR